LVRGGDIIFFASFYAASAIYLAKIDSSLSIDSAVETVSITAKGTARSFPLSEACCGMIPTAGRSLLVVGRSGSSRLVMTKSMTFGAESVCVEFATTGDEGVLGAHMDVLGLGGREGRPAAIIPSNFCSAS
jgi:hypothetical protein